MAITLDAACNDTIELSDFIELVDKSSDHLSIDVLLSHGEHLQMLSNNRKFLVDHIVGELKNIHDYQPSNGWNSQTIMLGGVAGKFAVRANVWLPRRMLHGTSADGRKPQFSFEQAHDHNYDFLTVGYLGRGYETEIWEHDDRCSGEAGEQVDLRFLERTSLPEHKVMLYRASKDVHVQLPPQDDFSISLNLLPPSIPECEQYLFDFEQSVVTKTFVGGSLGQQWLTEAAGHLCDDNISEVLLAIATKHGSEKIRRAARRSLAIRWPGLADEL
ncbi:hypothetical protein QCM77_07175 [Bradyrhizobium sp. SSUT18]|uniref:hypothetical protein n=1 Tax=unclassified Bradyrhizobium TaxID=2631580 RepID=UPI00244AA6EF|nr:MULTISPECIES: hypothetical protein [unclassified Bradyrhizobium]MDH2350185.1 hypothetical protein [Bradyrhizobium sp. SSUT112]MDH2399727.1 hypothetical protein [Bradyrhizobium sp. SSUT18]